MSSDSSLRTLNLKMSIFVDRVLLNLNYFNFSGISSQFLPLIFRLSMVWLDASSISLTHWTLRIDTENAIWRHKRLLQLLVIQYWSLFSTTWLLAYQFDSARIKIVRIFSRHVVSTATRVAIGRHKVLFRLFCWHFCTQHIRLVRQLVPLYRSLILFLNGETYLGPPLVALSNNSILFGCRCRYHRSSLRFDGSFGDRIEIGHQLLRVGTPFIHPTSINITGPVTWETLRVKDDFFLGGKRGWNSSHMILIFISKVLMIWIVVLVMARFVGVSNGQRKWIGVLLERGPRMVAKIVQIFDVITTNIVGLLMKTTASLIVVNQ